MRIWLSGPRLFRGLVRPGISLGKEDLRAIRKTPAMAVTAAIALFRRKDGAILMAIGDKSGAPVQTDMPDISMADMPPVAVFSFPSTPAAVDVREGARARLAKHIGQDGLVVGQSVGQVVAAIKAEMTALDVEGKFVRVEIETAPEPGTEPQHRPKHDLGTIILTIVVWGVIGLPFWFLIAHWLGGLNWQAMIQP